MEGKREGRGELDGGRGKGGRKDGKGMEEKLMNVLGERKC